jgi:antitoxin component of RelBE/YafQ-DinJ toxin-antitoxin module
MQRTILQIPMSKDLKEKAETVSYDLGFSSIQEAIRVLLMKLSKREFSLRVEETEEINYLSPKAERKFKKAVADIKAGRNVTKTENVDKLLELLKS